jgi:hypothetical protein
MPGLGENNWIAEPSNDWDIPLGSLMKSRTTAKTQRACSLAHVALANDDTGDSPKHSLKKSAGVFLTRSRYSLIR